MTTRKNKTVGKGSKPIRRNKSVMAGPKNKTVGAGSKTARKNKPARKENKGKIIKWTSLVILIVGAIIIFLLSDLFNIKEIKVLDNNKISAQEIINLSGLRINENMFKFLKIKVTEDIKTNPYIESVNIHRKLDRNNRN